SELYAEISLGTPPQSFKTVLDMAHNDFWVPSSKCGSLNIPCKTHNKYDCTNSTTYKEDGSKFKVKYKIGSASGFLSQDKFCMSSSICIEDQTFGEATSESISPFADAIHDGILGMGFSEGSFLSNLMEDDLIEDSLFSIWLNSKPFQKTGNSQLLLGEIDASLYTGNITYLPLNSDSVWKVGMK
ncbi:Cathepsin D, partial [Caligus rogercresseyi]